MAGDKEKANGDKQKNLRKDLPIVAHEFSLDELAAEYNVSFEKGLTSAQVEESRKKHGENRLTPPKVKPAWMLYLEQYTNFFSLLLIAGGVLCFIAYGIDQSDPSNLYLGAVLLLVVFISSTFAYFQEAKSQAIMEGFKSLIPKKCKVVRDGAPNVLDAVDLVPGDLVEFQEGDQVPADIRVFDSYNLKVDNSALTGELRGADCRSVTCESEACERGPHLHVTNHAGDIETGEGGKPTRKIPAIEATNLLFYSTIVASGHGRGIVIGTGDNTVMGQIAGLTGETTGDSQPPIVREVGRGAAHRRPGGSDASESGLIKAVQLLRDVREYRAEYPKLFEIKFNSTNKYQIGIHDQTKDGDQRPLLLMKGAPERVWSMCDRILINGREVPKTPEWEAKFGAAYESLGALGERVLGFAYRPLDGIPHNHPWTDQPAPNFPVSGLVFAGLFSLIDPPRLGVPEAVATCKRAAVRVFMVTGDHPITAAAIAEQIGILDRDKLESGKGKVVTGDDIRQLMDIEDDVARTAAWDNILLRHEQIVFARVTPAHKLLIVENNQRLKRVVAVTGDGVNDAPALKKADIGISMGIAGKDVSKEAADMILMDDNFASIVNGVEEGRLIFDNLKKSINYTLTSKVPELSPFLLWVIAGLPLATTTILILAIDLGTDMVPAISFAYETREADIMSRPPRNAHTDHLVNLKLLLFTYLHIGVMQALAGWFGYFVTMNDYGYAPWTLPGLGHKWDKGQLLCTVGDAGQPSRCGFACDSFNANAVRSAVSDAAGLTPAQEAALAAATPDFCADGCFSNNAYNDPFSEFAPGGLGFRGFAAGVAATCSRTCAWYSGLSAQQRSFYLAESANPASDYRLILTPQDDSRFRSFCGSAFNATLSAAFGFAGRGQLTHMAEAPVGSRFYWGAALQNAPNTKYQRRALSQGQTAYFVAVVMNKVIAALMSKTRKLSIFSQGIMNNKFMLGGFVFEACIVVLIAYVPPLNVVFSTGPISGLHWLPGIPWFLLCFLYDEGRKALMRASPGGWVERLTYW
ncbi:hypothetical protein GPECTOR_10g882 [Gonium pectorale]|uniref:Cation-transporting P-type ATPase N-terminal domain-containing protein n=1 Tax=Gonium pectorale TaxID=33097 RepID=A0A150GR17_GONPE|nr:hypothetical protein GPECTOR_10g882 [Gonium pectorale]|eukprot:KXZ52251.1 hypothetical protein GPECTOR_10g882 [Gonium pectorale]